MQNDCKLPKEQRRNYKHAIDGLIRISREEGPKKLLNGKLPNHKNEIPVVLFRCINGCYSRCFCYRWTNSLL
jgi:dicarboxylate transporter 10